MKYGKINYNYGDFALRTSGYNIGDAIQTIALEQIYKYIGLRDSDVIEIGLCDINTYDGEYVLLPIYSYVRYLWNSCIYVVPIVILL